MFGVTDDNRLPIGSVLTPDIRDNLDWPPEDVGDNREAYERHLAEVFQVLGHPTSAAGVAYQQHIADMLWRGQHDPEALNHRVRALLTHDRKIPAAEPPEPAATAAEAASRRQAALKAIVAAITQAMAANRRGEEPPPEAVAPATPACSSSVQEASCDLAASGSAAATSSCDGGQLDLSHEACLAGWQDYRKLGWTSEMRETLGAFPLAPGEDPTGYFGSLLAYSSIHKPSSLREWTFLKPYIDSRFCEERRYKEQWAKSSGKAP